MAARTEVVQQRAKANRFEVDLLLLGKKNPFVSTIVPLFFSIIATNHLSLSLPMKINSRTSRNRPSIIKGPSLAAASWRFDGTFAIQFYTADGREKRINSTRADDNSSDDDDEPIRVVELLSIKHNGLQIESGHRFTAFS